MRPFGWLPNSPKWTFKPVSSQIENSGNSESSNELKQITLRVNAEWSASHNLEELDSYSRREIGEIIEQCNIRASSGKPTTWEEGLDPTELWPLPSTELPTLDMNPALAPGYLEAIYHEFLLGVDPLALFSKHVLPKARMGLDSALFLESLTTLFVSPTELDSKYAIDTESTFVAQVRQLVDDMSPISVVMKRLRIRETQLQLIIGLELVSTIQTDRENVNKLLDLHFDRLCIWQAVDGTNVVSEFCSTILIPFFKARAPWKTKQYIRISRGTLKTRQKSSSSKGAGRRSLSPVPSVSASAASPRPTLTRNASHGLLKALQMQNLSVPPTPASASTTIHDTSSGTQEKARHQSNTAASRSISHPVYRQQSRHSQVEVRFKKGRSKESKILSSSPPPVPASRNVSRSSAPPVPPAPPPPAATATATATATSQGFQPTLPEFVEATPTKVRTTYLGVLPPQTTLFDGDGDDAIGSTDSDD